MDQLIPVINKLQDVVAVVESGPLLDLPQVLLPFLFRPLLSFYVSPPLLCPSSFVWVALW